MALGEPVSDARSFTVSWPSSVQWPDSPGVLTNGVGISYETTNELKVQLQQMQHQLSIQHLQQPKTDDVFAQLRSLVERIDGHSDYRYMQRVCELLGQIVERLEAEKETEERARDLHRIVPLRQRRIRPPER